MDLHRVNLHGAFVEWAKLQGAFLFDANLRDANLRDASLQEARLIDADLQGAFLFDTNLQGARLRSANLQQAKLDRANLQRAVLEYAKLQGAHLGWANLQGADLYAVNLQGARLRFAKLQGARLSAANLQGADLWWANLEGANLRGADLRRVRLANVASLRDAELEGVDWGDYKLGEEIAGNFGEAASVYRALKQRHTELGMYDIAGEFHYREMEARRKLVWNERHIPYILSMYLLRLLYGYSERPERVIGWAAAVVFGLALVHWLFGTVSGGFVDALYFSAVSFPALGYGHWAPEPQGWAGRFLGAGESFMGVFMMALFLVTFTRKMTR